MATPDERRAGAFAERYPYYLANEPVHGDATIEVTDKYTGAVATRVARADAAAIDRAIETADACAHELRRWPAFRRKAVLEHLRDRMRERFDELSVGLSIENGKALQDARGEVQRGLDTVTIALEESVRHHGEMQELEISPRAEGYQGFWRRVPVGACGFIAPFNFPINLVLHKVAPAIAVGCPWVLKPASTTPVGAIMLAEILAETDLPRGAFSVLPCAGADAEPLATDDRLKVLSFTGSPEVGWALKAKAGRKSVVLELGGNAGCIVDRDADLDDAIGRIVGGAFKLAGQSCISVQRVLVHRAVYDRVRDGLVAGARGLRSGDPLDDATDLGPLIGADDGARLEAWINEAVERGATVLTGGGRNGAFVEPTILENVPHDARVSCEEAFGPVMTIAPFDSMAAAFDVVNDSAFGLQAGLFTRDLHHAFRAFDELDVGGVVVNDIPSMRVDAMPYGGTKDSGTGREGVRFAIEHLTEVKLMVLRRLDRDASWERPGA